MVYFAYFTELILQICDYAQKQRICRKNCKYALDGNFHGHFCPRRKAAKFCHPALFSTMRLSQTMGFSEQQLWLALWHFFISLLNKGGKGAVKKITLSLPNTGWRIWFQRTKFMDIILQNVVYTSSYKIIPRCHWTQFFHKSHFTNDWYDK